MINAEYRKLIANEFRNCVSGTLARISNEEPTYRPFHTALLSREAVIWSRFERSFSTSFGQRVIEELARLVALSSGAEAARQKETTITIDIAYEEAIAIYLRGLRERNHTVQQWDSLLQNILTTPKAGRMTPPIRVISDLWWRKDGVDHFISLKTVKPNIDQTVVAKQDCLRLAIAIPGCKPYFGLPYNPYGSDRRDYAFNPPMGVFNFASDSVVLIGKEMWDTLGGSGCYEEILAIAEEVGKDTQEEIKAAIF